MIDLLLSTSRQNLLLCPILLCNRFWHFDILDWRTRNWLTGCYSYLVYMRYTFTITFFSLWHGYAVVYDCSTSCSSTSLFSMSSHIQIHIYIWKYILYCVVFLSLNIKVPLNNVWNHYLYFQRRFHAKYGRIFKEPLGPVTNVSIADPKLVEEVMRNEGKYPSRPPYDAWMLYKKMRNKSSGILSA